MRLRFEGWRRVVVNHDHPVKPVRNVGGSWTPGKANEPIAFVTPRLARGQVTGLSLTGDFMVSFDLTPEDLEAWIQNYIEKDPEGAKAFLRTMLNDAEGRWSADSAMDPAVWSPG